MTTARKGHVRLVLTLAIVALMVAGAAHARTFHCAAQDVWCVIAAIEQANANGGHANRIRLSPGTLTLVDIDNDVDGANGLPSITSTLTIEVTGDKRAEISRAADAPSFRIFHVAPEGHLVLKAITVSNGRSDRSEGGGIFNRGEVTMVDSALVGNWSNASSGGGLFNRGGRTTIRRSTFARNLADAGGGLENSGGDVTIVDSLFDQNSGPPFDGGALVNFGGRMRIIRSRIARNVATVGGGLSVLDGSVLIDETTFEGNIAAFLGHAIAVSEAGHLAVENSSLVEHQAGPVFGVGDDTAVVQNRGTAEVTNTTFAGNTLTACFRTVPIAIDNVGTLVLTNVTFAENVLLIPEGYNCHILNGFILSSRANATTILRNTILAHKPEEGLVEDCEGPVTSLGHNLIGDPSGCTITLQSDDLTGNPGLGVFSRPLPPLPPPPPGEDFVPLLPGSQAIDAGNDAICTDTDQLGRPRLGPCDIGAVEFRDTRKGKKKGKRQEHFESEDREDTWRGFNQHDSIRVPH